MGSITNTNLVVVQQAIAGYEGISIAGGAQTTALLMTQNALATARNAVIKLTGTITGNQIVTVPIMELKKLGLYQMEQQVHLQLHLNMQELEQDKLGLQLIKELKFYMLMDQIFKL
jgi:hypothetical protein